MVVDGLCVLWDRRCSFLYSSASTLSDVSRIKKAWSNTTKSAAR